MNDGIFKTPIKFIQWDGKDPEAFISETGCCTYTWRTEGIMRLSDTDGYDDLEVGDYVVDFGPRSGKQFVSQDVFKKRIEPCEKI